MKLDYTLSSVEDRKRYVERLLDEEEYVSPQQLGYMADYLLFAADGKQTLREKEQDYPIVTKNREVTINKRQISFEGAVAKLQNGEDGLYSMMIDDKNVIMDVRDPITAEDVRDIPGMRENREAIESLKSQFERSTGKRRYQLKQQIISKYQEMYTLKASFSGHVSKARVNAQIRSMAHMSLPETIELDDDDMPRSDGLISLLKQDHVAFLLKYYQQLKQESWEDLNSDMRWLLIDLEDTVVRALLPDNEILYDLLVWEIDGCTGSEIVEKMADKYGVFHSEQYFSTLWCKRIPKLVSEQAQKDWVVWHFRTKHPQSMYWKTCRTCGRTKPAHPLFFHKNTSKDGFYSKCRDCRSKKKS